MNEPVHTQWQTRRALNGFCKETPRNEAVNAHNHVKWRQSQETIFSDLSPQEENQLYTYDRYLVGDKAEQFLCVAGKEISTKLLAEVIHSSSEEKHKAVLLYYFFDMSDAGIAELYTIPRSIVRYRRTSSLALLKRYLEERAYDENRW